MPARGDKATIAAGECDIRLNGHCDIPSFRNAFSVLDECTLKSNRCGAQKGTSKGKDGRRLFLNRCTIFDSRESGAGALDGTLNLVNCTFTNNKKL